MPRQTKAFGEAFPDPQFDVLSACTADVVRLLMAGVNDNNLRELTPKPPTGGAAERACPDDPGQALGGVGMAELDPLVLAATEESMLATVKGSALSISAEFARFAMPLTYRRSHAAGVSRLSGCGSKKRICREAATCANVPA